MSIHARELRQVDTTAADLTLWAPALRQYRMSRPLRQRLTRLARLVMTNTNSALALSGRFQVSLLAALDVTPAVFFMSRSVASADSRCVPRCTNCAIIKVRNHHTRTCPWLFRGPQSIPRCSPSEEIPHVRSLQKGPARTTLSRSGSCSWTAGSPGAVRG